MSALLDSLLSTSKSTSLPTAEAKIRAFAWARVSTDMQEEKGLSMPEQLIPLSFQDGTNPWPVGKLTDS